MQNILFICLMVVKLAKVGKKYWNEVYLRSTRLKYPTVKTDILTILPTSLLPSASVYRIDNFK